jgi:hypothetical protein
MLEAILRKAIPRPLLRKLAIEFNTVKLNTVDKLFYSSYPIQKEEYFKYHEEQPYGVLHEIVGAIDDPVIKKGLLSFVDRMDTEYILEYNKGCYIEPGNGWGISKKAKLIYSSLGTSHAAYLKKPSWLAFYTKRKKAQRLQQAISLRDISERAYFHFYNDVIAKIPYLVQHGYEVNNIPIIVAERAFNKPFFQDLLAASPFFRSLNWVIQRDQYIYCDHIIFVKPPALDKVLYDTIADVFINDQPATEHNKIFITRDKKRLRYIDNMPQVEAVLTKHGFRVVDADRLSLPEQAVLFRNTRYLAGIHGAGMTNMIFRKDYIMSMLEIFPPQPVIPYHYAVLAHTYDYRYQAMQGQTGKSKYSGGFIVDPEKLDHMLDIVTE